MPHSAERVLEILNDKGYAAYVVGGCVRDSLLGITPHDWDITTDATPDEVEMLFTHTIPTGKKYGTITVGFSEEQTGEEVYYEITTFRADGNYSDGRRPDNVTFGKSILEDLARRDFTINAMAYNPLVGLVDPYNGRKDLENGIIKCVGNSMERLQEDALRILRAIRFSCKYRFTIDQQTENAMYGLRESIFNVSKERIVDELLQILYYTVDGQAGILKRVEYELATILGWKDYNSFNDDCVWEQIANDRMSAGLKLYVILSKFRDIVDAEIWLRKSKYSNSIVKEIMTYYRLQDMSKQGLTDVNIRKMFSKYAYVYVFNFLHIYAKVSDKRLVKLCSQPHSLDDLAVNGDDIKALGLFGRYVGECLNMLLDAVIVDPKLNNEKQLLELARRYRDGR